MDKLPNGFRQVPGIARYAVNQKGAVYDIVLKKLSPTHLVPSGYVLTGYAEKGKTKSFRVHRLVAMAWIPVPEYLQNINVRVVVNHKDGKKSHNEVSNLEWTTDKGNQEHAIANGLTDHKRVKARNLLSNEEFSFSSAHDASRHFGVRVKKLIRVLNSEYAGKITKDYWVFLYEDQEWPEITPELIIQDRWDKLKGLWVAVKNGVKLVGSTLDIVCNMAGVKYFTIQPEVRADGKSYFVCGIEFYYSNFPTKELIEAAVYSEEGPKFRPTRKVLVSITSPIVQSKEFPSIRQASKETGVAINVIAYAITRKGGYHKGMHFKYVD